MPALIVAAFAAVTLNRGLDAWFSERTRSIVDSAVTVAEAYMRDHGETARGDIAAIAADLNNQKLLFDGDRPDFVRRVARHAALRGLVGAFVFDTSLKRIDANVTLNNKIAFRAPSAEAIERADRGELVVMPPGEGGNIIRALIKLTNFPSDYLYVYRAINPSVIDQLDETRAAKAEYDQLLQQRSGVQITFALMYAGVSLIFLLAAIWLGLVVRRPHRGAGGEPAQCGAACVGRRSRCQGQRGRWARRSADAGARLQPHDLSVEGAAQRAHDRQSPARRTPPLHRGDAVGRLGGRHRRRS